ncbi:MAG: hypothetical protein M3Q07_06065 [Pseudobdellovibrionaceae bacterium]|nr:hypothetical protein [Pseudobdellovibrionaceae bacterium]
MDSYGGSAAKNLWYFDLELVIFASSPCPGSGYGSELQRKLRPGNDPFRNALWPRKCLPQSLLRLYLCEINFSIDAESIPLANNAFSVFLLIFRAVIETFTSVACFDHGSVVSKICLIGSLHKVSLRFHKS